MIIPEKRAVASQAASEADRSRRKIASLQAEGAVLQTESAVPQGIVSEDYRAPATQAWVLVGPDA